MTDLVERVARALCKSMCEEEVWPCWDTTEQECHCWDTQIPQARAAVLETLRVMMEPTTEAMRIAGVQELGAQAEKLKAYYEDPERAGRDYGSAKMMPTVGVLLVGSDQSDAVWQAMLTQKIKEVEGDG